MTHVTALLAAYVGGELDPAASREVDTHLATCAACRAEAARIRSTWDLLEAAAVPASSTRVDLWTGVRERTIAPVAGGWFFGRSRAARLSLAVATVALGVLVGRWTGTLGTAGAADDDADLAGVWLEDSTWHDQASGGLADSWLALADPSDQADSRVAAGNGGTK